MAGNADSPNEVDQFVLAHIDSVPHLESLLLLWNHRNVSWSAEDVAARLYVDPAKANKILQDLQREDLVVHCPNRRNSSATTRDRWSETG